MTVTLGKSVEGRPIRATIHGHRHKPTLLVLGGFHGDEPKSVSLAHQLIDEIKSHATAGQSCCWVVVPLVNPDGYQRRRRRNANKIDINRNFPTKNWQTLSRRSRMYGGDEPGSEPETMAVIKAVTRFRPQRIVTIHSIGAGRECNNYDGPAKRLAKLMSRRNGYPATASIGYPTPGSFGAWAGIERRIPTITLELPSLHSAKRCWAENRDALLAWGQAAGPSGFAMPMKP